MQIFFIWLRPAASKRQKKVLSLNIVLLQFTAVRLGHCDPGGRIMKKLTVVVTALIGLVLVPVLPANAVSIDLNDFDIIPFSG